MMSTTPDNWLQSLIVFIACLGVLSFVLWNAMMPSKPKEKMFFGQQFNESDLKGTTGKLNKLAVACDLTTTIVPDLFSDGFIPLETSTTQDVEDNIYVMTFWQRLDTRIVTESDAKGVTCIISVSNNVKSLQSDTPTGQIDGEPRDKDDGIIPL
jgi:hypothetical protein